MNLEVRVFAYLPEDQWNPDGVGALLKKLSDTVVDEGYGNVADDDPEQTKLTSVLVARPAGDWRRATKDAMAVSFPTDDPKFVIQADAGGIIE